MKQKSQVFAVVPFHSDRSYVSSCELAALYIACQRQDATIHTLCIGEGDSMLPCYMIVKVSNVCLS